MSTGLEPRFITAELTLAEVNPAMADLIPLAARALRRPSKQSTIFGPRHPHWPRTPAYFFTHAGPGGVTEAAQLPAAARHGRDRVQAPGVEAEQ